MDDSSAVAVLESPESETPLAPESTAITPREATPLAVIPPSPAPLAKSEMDPKERARLQRARIIFESKMFPKIKSIAEVATRLWLAEQLGISELAAMTGITVIGSSLNLHYTIYGSKINLHPTYRYKTTKLTNEVCEIEFYDGDELRGTSSFTLDDAKRAGLIGGDNWRNHPKNMLFSNTMNNGSRFYFPDLIGAPFDLAEENSEVDGE